MAMGWPGAVRAPLLLAGPAPAAYAATGMAIAGSRDAAAGKAISSPRKKWVAVGPVRPARRIGNTCAASHIAASPACINRDTSTAATPRAVVSRRRITTAAPAMRRRPLASPLLISPTVGEARVRERVRPFMRIALSRRRAHRLSADLQMGACTRPRRATAAGLKIAPPTDADTQFSLMRHNAEKMVDGQFSRALRPAKRRPAVGANVICALRDRILPAAALRSPALRPSPA